MTHFLKILLLAIVMVASAGYQRVAVSQELPTSIRPVFDERFDDWPEKLKIGGRIFINRGLKDLQSVDRILAEILKEKRVVSFAPEQDAFGNELKELLTDISNVDQAEAGNDKLKTALQNADAVYISGDAFTASQLGDMRGEFASFIDRGGCLIADAAWAGMLGDISGSDSEPPLDLIPGCYVDCEFDGDSESKNRLTSFLSNHKRSLGIAIEPETMLMISGRTLLPFGGSTTLAVAACQSNPAKFQTIKSRRTPTAVTRADLAQWRRIAIDQTLERFPAASPKSPFVENGSLYIVGGGGVPNGLFTEMIEKAGGLEHARLVYIPCSEAEDVGQRQRTVQSWKRMGVKHATFLHTKDRNKANTDDEFLTPLKDATMLWFGGGRQWNFADSWYGTKAHRMMKGVLHRGGVIGGSSAGASIQGRFLARATPIGNLSILAAGYERGGLGFLSGVAIDQHFSQRGRQKDMTTLVEKYPQLLGIGIDESTAIVVEKSRAKIVGRGKVFFYDRSQPVDADGKESPGFVALAAGEEFDLEKREVVVGE